MFEYSMYNMFLRVVNAYLFKELKLPTKMNKRNINLMHLWSNFRWKSHVHNGVICIKVFFVRKTRTCKIVNLLKRNVSQVQLHERDQ